MEKLLLLTDSKKSRINQHFFSCIYFREIWILRIVCVYLFSRMPFSRKFRVYLISRNRSKFAKFAEICTRENEFSWGRAYRSGNKTHLFCQVTWPDHMIKGTSKWVHLNISHHCAKFDAYTCCANGYMMFSFCHVILHSHNINGILNFASGGPSP